MFFFWITCLVWVKEIPCWNGSNPSWQMTEDGLGRLPLNILMTCGVPQESVLSPIKFKINMQPLSGIIRRYRIGCQQYVDDTQLNLSLQSDLNLEAVDTINQGLEVIMSWTRANKLKLNTNRMQVFLVGWLLTPEFDISPVLDVVTLPLKTEVWSL